MQTIKFNEILLVFLTFQYSIENIKAAINTNQSCRILTASNYFCGLRTCFTHSIDSIKEINVYYLAQVSITGISFLFINGYNMSYIENSNFSSIEKIYLNNSDITGADIWIGASGITGLKFQIYDNYTSTFRFTPQMGSINGCLTNLNSSYLNANYFKLKSISGCVDSNNSKEFPSLAFNYEFSKCSILATTTTSTTTATSTTTTATCPLGWMLNRNSCFKVSSVIVPNYDTVFGYTSHFDSTFIKNSCFNQPGVRLGIILNSDTNISSFMSAFNDCYFDAFRAAAGNSYTGLSSIFYSILTPGNYLSASYPAWNIDGGGNDVCVRIELSGNDQYFKSHICGEAKFFICEFVL